MSITYVCQAALEPFMKAAKEVMADQYTPEVGKCYRKTMRWVINILVLGFRWDQPQESDAKIIE